MNDNPSPRQQIRSNARFINDMQHPAVQQFLSLDLSGVKARLSCHAEKNVQPLKITGVKK